MLWLILTNGRIPVMKVAYFRFATFPAFSLGLLSTDTRRADCSYCVLLHVSEEQAFLSKLYKNCRWFHKVNLTFPISEQKLT